MFLRTITIKGITRLYFYESYFENGKTKQKCLESLGRLDELQKKYGDPVSHFKRIAEERTLEKKTARKTSVSISLDDAMGIREYNIENVGYSVLKELYKQLELDKFWKLRLKNTSIKYDLEAVSRLLVFSHILYPASKLETFHAKDAYFEKMGGLF